MNNLVKLPETEFEIMKVIWSVEPPVTTNVMMEALGNQKGWKVPTLISFLNRLMKKNFLESEKKGKERLYYPLIGKEEYLKFETANFMRAYHGNSLLSFTHSLYDGNGLSEKDVMELRELIEKKE